MKQTVIIFFALIFSSSSTIVHAQATNDAQALMFEAFEKILARSIDPQILDVRSPAEFKENHLKGAINFYVKDENTFTTGIENLRKDKPVFVYSINNGRSGVVSKKLRDAGFAEVYPLPGGLAHWIGEGKPIESSAGNGLTQEEYLKLVSSENVVLVDVGSRHCGGCKKLEPVIDEVSKEQALKVVKVELYDNRQLAKDLDIESVPTLLLYKGNKVIWRKSGHITKVDIQDALEKSM